MPEMPSNQRRRCSAHGLRLRLRLPSWLPSWLRAGLPWPAPALLSWVLAWALAWLLQQHAPALGGARIFALAASLGVLAALWQRRAGWLRCAMLVAGFPLSALAGGWSGGWSGGWAVGPAWAATPAALPAWAWLLPLAALLAAYPLRTWRDAPLFPTPRGALQGLQACVALPPGAMVLDAGCGLGHGLLALRAALPTALIHGIECSWPLRLLSAWRCPWASVRQGDMWRQPWQGLALVYVFQRPETMARAWAKAQAEMAGGAWLASLEFAVPGLPPDAVLQPAGGKPLWLYQLPLPQPARQAAQPLAGLADNHPRKPAPSGRRRHPA